MQFLHSLSKKTWFPFLAIAIIVGALYAQTLSYSFVHLDEDDHILNRIDFLRTASNIPKIFFHDTYFPVRSSPFYRPLQTLSFMGDAFLWGVRPFGYHLMNVILHIGTTFLFYALLRKLDYRKRTALFTALIFALHPVVTRNVAWVPGRNDLLLGIFALSSLLFFLNGLRKRSFLAYVGHFFFLMLALLTKETAAVIPVLAIVLWLLQREGIKKKDFILISAWVMIIVAWLVVRFHALLAIQRASFDIILGALWTTKFPIALLSYLGKSILPVHLSVMPVLDVTSIILGFGVFAFLVGWHLLVGRWPTRSSIAGLIWFLASLIPPMIVNESEARAVYFEHRLYIPLMGVLLMILGLPRVSALSHLHKYRTAIQAACLIFLAVLSMEQMRDFRNGEVFWKSAVRSSPSLSRAHDGLGNFYASQNQLNAAIAQYRKAIELAPQEKRLHNDLGVAYLKLRNVAAAEAEFRQELVINPNYVPARHNLGITYGVEKKYKEAEEQWNIALALDPAYVLSHQAMAAVLAAQNRYEDAMVHIRAIESLGVPLVSQLERIKAQYEDQKALQ